MGWKFKAERPGRLKVDDELELRRLLNGHFRRGAALDDAIDKRRRAVQRIGDVRAETISPPASANSRQPYIAGRRCCTASSAIRLRLYNEKLCAKVISASAPAEAALVNA